MSVWWQDLSLRERVLIAAAGVLFVLVISWQFILSPALNARSAARASLHEASTDLSLASQLISRRNARSLSAQDQATGSAAAPTGDAFKTAVTQAATQRGLAIGRLQTGEAGRLGLVFDRVDPRLFFLWLNEVETRYDGQVLSMPLDQPDDGSVRATLDLSAGGD